jgi:hypothetical protein
MRALTRRAPQVAVVALALGGVLLVTPIGVAPARAGDGLVTVMDATYQVLPEEQRVQVTVDAVSTSHEADTPEGRVYYAGISITVPPGATNIAATSNGTPQSITVSEGPDAVRVDIGFSQQIFFNQSFPYQITFDMVDPGGAANRDFRIGHSVVAFPVWAFGSAGVEGNSVTVDLPPTFIPSVYGGPLDQAILADGTVHLTADNTDATSWVAYVSAERPGIFTTTPFSLNVGDANASVIIRAWDDDPQWAARTMALLTDGLPALQQLIGLSWPVAGDLNVEESANRLGDYAGIYNPVTEKVNVRYDADATVTLHEAAHVWFNDHLFRDRWIDEAWAEFYAAHAAEVIGVPSETFSLDDSMLASKIPLNDWGVIGAETRDVEAYAYAASSHLADLIFARTDLAELRSVWKAADASEMAYQPLHGGENPRAGGALGQADWQRLLDLLEERTGAAYDDLWAEWVVNGGQRADLAERSIARERYREVATDAGPWELPESIRSEMSSWQFQDALGELAVAEDVLGVADEVAALAVELDLTAPRTLEYSFEGTNGLGASLDEARNERAAAQIIATATQELGVEQGFVGWVGLLFTDPAGDIGAARAAWEDGDSDAASTAASAAVTTLETAEDQGRQRLLIGGTVVVVFVGGGAVIAARRRREPEDGADQAPYDAPDAPADPPPSDVSEA